MALGSANLTTWKAKRIIGDSSASTAADALLQTGTGVGDLWILNCTNRNTDYGIFYEYTGNDDNDQIKLIGDGNTNIILNLKTGAARFGNYVSIRRETTATLNDKVQLRMAIKDTSIQTETSPNGREQSANVITAYHTHADNNGGMNIVMYSAGNMFFGTGEAPPNLYTLKYNAATNNILTGENLFIVSDSAIYLEAGANEDTANNKTIADRVGLQIASSGNIIPMKAEVKNDNAQNLGASDARFANIYGVTFRGNLVGNVTGNVTGDLTGTADYALRLKNSYTVNTRPTNANIAHVNDGGVVHFKATSSMTSNNPGSDGNILHFHWDTDSAWNSQLHIPDSSSGSMHWRGSSAAGTWGNWYTILDSNNCGSYALSTSGGTITGNLSIKRSTTIANRSSNPAALYLKPNQTDNNLLYESAYLAAYDDGDQSNYGVNLVLTGGGNIIIGSGESGGNMYSNAVYGKTADANISAGANSATFSETGESLILCSDGAIYFLTNCQTIGNRNLSYINTSGYFYASRVYNAVWNDYAECRIAEIEEPGRCVTESSNGKMKKTTKRLMPGCKLISDTYGTCMGETSLAKAPIAVAGRVLAYPYRAREEYELGAAVCSAPNGTVDIMTREEIMMYPERIVGTVSEIPTYDTWYGSSNSVEEGTAIPVRGRIWIYVR